MARSNKHVISMHLLHNSTAPQAKHLLAAKESYLSTNGFKHRPCGDKRDMSTRIGTTVSRCKMIWINPAVQQHELVAHSVLPTHSKTEREGVTLGFTRRKTGKIPHTWQNLPLHDKPGLFHPQKRQADHVKHPEKHHPCSPVLIPSTWPGTELHHAISHAKGASLDLAPRALCTAPLVMMWLRTPRSPGWQQREAFIVMIIIVMSCH